jgi:hypothetical protein
MLVLWAVEGCANFKKIRVIQRQAYGLRDEEYLRLKGDVPELVERVS